MPVVVERAANFLNALDERVFGYDDFGPEGMEQLVLGRDPTAMLDEVAKRQERRARSGSSVKSPKT